MKDTGNYETWCAEFDELMVTVNDVMTEGSTPLDPERDEVHEPALSVFESRESANLGHLTRHR